MNSIIDIYSNVIKSRDARRVISNFSYLSILQIGSYVLPILTYPYLARVIGVEGFGKIAFAMSIVVYFTTITDWGYNFSATRDVARNRDDVESISRIYSVVTTSKLFLLFISIIILAALLLFVPRLKEDVLLYILSFFIVIGQTIFPEWLFQGLENMKLIVILNLISKLLFTFLIFIFIKSPDDYILQPLFSGCGYILSGLISLYFVHKRIKLKYEIPSFKDVFVSVKRSFDVFLNNLMPNLYTSVSVLILGFWGGSIANGILDGATKFYSICAQFLNVMSRAFFPFLSRRLEKHLVYVRVKLTVTIVFSLILFLGADFLIKTFLSNSFQESVLPLRIFAISLIFHSLTNIYGTNYLILIGKEGLLRKITVYVSVLCFTLAFPLIYYFSYIGAVFTISFARILLGSIVYIVAKLERRKFQLTV